MNFLAPGWIALAAVTSLAVAAIHLIAWRLPRRVSLPTARFVPDEPARRAARTVRPSDLALLALRVAMLMVAGLAMAGPVSTASPTGSATVIAVARSGDTTALRDSLRAIPRSRHTAFIVYDTAARVFGSADAALGDIAQAPAGGEGSLTVGLLAATREARRLEQEYDTVRLVIASSFPRRSFDDASFAVRAMWPYSIRLIRLPPETRPSLPTGIQTDARGDDPVIAGVRLAQSNGLIRGDARIVRETASAGDSAWADSGHAVVIWPRARADVAQRVDGVLAGGFTAIGHFLPLAPDDSGQVIARWVNGAPAAWEYRRGAGCLRTIAFDVADLGDFVLTPSFQRLAAELVGPCGGVRSTAVAPDSMIAALSAPTDEPPVVGAAVVGRNRLAAALMALAVLLGLVELWARRRPALHVLPEHGA